MEAYVGAEITIHNPTQDAEDYFARKLTYDNPEYFKKLNSGRWLGNTPKTISLLQRRGNDIVIPFGMLPDVFKHRSSFDAIRSDFSAVSGVPYKSNVELYRYQSDAITAALKAKQGVIVAPCGAGKTQIGLEIASRIGGKTLWLTHTSDLLNQSMERAKACFDLISKDYGTITGGKVDIGNVLTFATVQTMVNLDLAQLKDFFDIIIVDECHHCVGSPTQVKMFYHVVSSLKARYKYGLTATPKRSDGLTQCMFSLLGDKICEIDRAAVKETTCPVVVKARNTGYIPDIETITAPDGTISFVELISDLIHCNDRNELIIDDIERADGTCLILTDRVSHIETLKRKLGQRGIASESLTSKSVKSQRNSAIANLNSKKNKVLIATYSLAKEGLDVPQLDNLFLTTPQKNEITVTQSAGRVARKAEGKQCGVIYDYVDNFGMLINWYKKRKAIYKKLDFISGD